MELVEKLLFIVSLSGAVFASEQQFWKNSISSDSLIPKTCDALVYILKFCQKDYDTIMISFGSNEMNLKWSQNLQAEVSMILHQNSSKWYRSMNSTKKIDALVFIIRSIDDLKEILGDFDTMEWWDVLTPIYIINIQMDGCNISEQVLPRLWGCEIVTSYFLCSDFHQEIKIYTYNPFTDRAPSHWRSLEKEIKVQRFTLYERKYMEGGICEEVNFDRTKHLDGYRIIVAYEAHNYYYSVVEQFIPQETIDKSPTLVHLLYEKVINAFAKALNVRYSIYFYPRKSSNKVYQESYYSFKKDIYKNSSFHIMLAFETMNTNSQFFPLIITYPLCWSGYGIATLHRGYQTPVEKMLHFYGLWICLFTLFILLTTFFVILFSENKRIAFAVFDILRLVISQSIYTRMNTLSLRIFFSMIFIYFLVIQATFNGHLAKFLTKPAIRKHADTLDDLHDLGYTSIYNTSFVKYQLAKSSKEIESMNSLTNTCLEYILHNDTSGACIGDYSMFYTESSGKKNLYISKIPFGCFSNGFPLSRRGPFKNRINIANILFEDLGFRKFWTGNFVHDRSYTAEVANANLYQDFRPISLKDLTFIFIILGIGFINATFSFFIEILVHKLM